MTWALAILTAVLLILIHPGADLPWIAPFALAPLLLALRLKRPGLRGGFALGFAAGMVYWFVHCNWIQFVLEVHGGMGRWGGWGCFLLFCAYKALHLGVFSAIAPRLMGRWWSPAAIAALWAGIERTHGTFGFAWLTLGNAATAIAPYIAPYAGVYALSFLLALIAAAIAERRWLWCAPAVLFGLALIPKPVPQATETAVAVQPNLDEETEWTVDLAARMRQRQFLMSMEAAAGARAHLVLWPESPGPYFYGSDPEFTREAQDFARTAQTTFLFGTVTYSPSGAPLNSAVMLAPSGEPVDRYSKRFLVPFGEFIPPLFGFVHKITKEAGNYAPGEKVVAFPYNGHRLGVFICYESAFPHLVRQSALAGADAFVNLSNDGYFGRSYAREQHLRLVQMRAIENRRWIVRPTNDGISASVDPYGRVRERLEPFREVAAPLHYGYQPELTFYARYGDWFAWSCLLVSLALAGLGASRNAGDAGRALPARARDTRVEP